MGQGRRPRYRLNRERRAVRLVLQPMTTGWMRRGYSICVVLAAMAACGAKSEGEMAQFSIKSSDGADQSPPLQWSAPPSGTKSFALVVDDPDAPSGTFRHWGAFNIPAVARELAPGAGNQDEGLMVQARNDFGKP